MSLNCCRQIQSGRTPGFKPIGGGASGSKTQLPMTDIIGIKRATPSSVESDSSAEATEKTSKLAKYGMKFQSAGTLMSIGEQIGKDTPLLKDGEQPREKKEGTLKPEVSSTFEFRGSGGSSSSSSLSSKLLARYTTAKWDKQGDFEKRLREAKEKEHDIRVESAPPPLKSRQKELNMENYSSSEDEEDGLTARTIIRKPAKFKFNLTKK